MAQTVIKCSGLKKQYGVGNTAVMALRGIDLEVFAGELFMLVGPSGCGKTTLISIIASILNASGGLCQVLGKDVNTMRDAEKVAFRAINIGFVFQAFNLLPALSAAQNVAVPLFINRVPYMEALAKANTLLGQVGLDDRANFPPSQLSGGQLQRVAIARALVHEPKIIVCDEPTSALDSATGQKVINLMQDLAKDHGFTLIIVTHDDRILHFADRIGYMEDGRIIRVETQDKKTTGEVSHE